MIDNIKQDDFKDYNNTIQATQTFIDLDVLTYLKGIKSINDKYLSDLNPIPTSNNQTINVSIPKDRMDFIREELTYDDQIKLKSIEKHYQIEIEKELLARNLSPFLVNMQPLQNIPSGIAQSIKLVNEWFIYKDFIQLDRQYLDFQSIQRNILLMVNPYTQQDYEKRFKDLLQYYPLMDSKHVENKIQLESYVQYFNQKAMELCYILNNITGNKDIEEIQKTVYCIVQELKQYHSLQANFIMDVIILYLTIQDMKQYPDLQPFLKDIDKTVLVNMISTRYDPSKGILFMNLKQDNPSLQKEQQDLYNKFTWQLPQWNLF